MVARTDRSVLLHVFCRRCELVYPAVLSARRVPCLVLTGGCLSILGKKSATPARSHILLDFLLSAFLCIQFHDTHGYFDEREEKIDRSPTIMERKHIVHARTPLGQHQQIACTVSSSTDIAIGQ